MIIRYFHYQPTMPFLRACRICLIFIEKNSLGLFIGQESRRPPRLAAMAHRFADYRRHGFDFGDSLLAGQLPHRRGLATKAPEMTPAPPRATLADRAEMRAVPPRLAPALILASKRAASLRRSFDFIHRRSTTRPALIISGRGSSRSARRGLLTMVEKPDSFYRNGRLVSAGRQPASRAILISPLAISDAYGSYFQSAFPLQRASNDTALYRNRCRRNYHLLSFQSARAKHVAIFPVCATRFCTKSLAGRWQITAAAGTMTGAQSIFSLSALACPACRVSNSVRFLGLSAVGAAA